MTAKSSKGAFLLLGSIILSSVLTYLLTKAKYEKKVVLNPGPAEPTKKYAAPEKGKEKEITLSTAASEPKNEVTKYTEMYKQKNDDISASTNENAIRKIIDADTFDSTDEFFEGVTFTLYADGTLTDEQGNIVTDPENNVGVDTIKRFNELEHNGAVYVRNYETNTDFEILLDLRSYKEASGGYANAKRT